MEEVNQENENKLITTKLSRLSKNLLRYIFDFFSYSKVRELLNLNRRIFKSLREYDFLQTIEERTLGLSNIKEIKSKPSELKKNSIQSIEYPIQNFEISEDLDLIFIHLNKIESQITVWTLSTHILQLSIIERDESDEILLNRGMKYISQHKVLVVLYNNGILYFYKFNIEQNNNTVNIYSKIDLDSSDFIVNYRVKFRRKIDQELFLSMHYCSVTDQLITLERTVKKKSDDIEITFMKFWNCCNGRHIKTKTYLDKSISHFNILNGNNKTNTILFFGNDEGTLYYQNYDKIAEEDENNIMIFYNTIFGESSITETAVATSKEGPFVVVSYANGNITTYLTDTKMKINNISLGNEFKKLSDCNK